MKKHFIHSNVLKEGKPIFIVHSTEFADGIKYIMIKENRYCICDSNGIRIEHSLDNKYLLFPNLSVINDFLQEGLWRQVTIEELALII